MSNTDKAAEVTPEIKTDDKSVPFFAAKGNGPALTVKTSVRAGGGARGEVLRK